MTVVLEGLHALKHAVRFGAAVTAILTDDLDKALAVADAVAPELRDVLVARAEAVPTARFRELAVQPVPTHVLAYAEPPTWTLGDALPRPGHPTVLLDDPRNSKNLGAVVRVAAAAGAAGVLVRGDADPYDRMAIRGAAGLQWAIPCIKVERRVDRLVGLDAGGEPLDPARYRTPTIFAFGSERTGLSEAVRSQCDEIVSLPMRAHVSSLNLATAVSAVLYLVRYAAGDLAAGR